jgi:hypothetical protein
MTFSKLSIPHPYQALESINPKKNLALLSAIAAEKPEYFSNTNSS